MKGQRQNPIRLAFYGDDFTGSTDALDFLVRAGIQTMLFLEPPSASDLEAFPSITAVGVAGMTRSLPSHQIGPLLEAAFHALKQLAPEFVHYKVCSTFDSSAQIGSIGIALEQGKKAFNNPIIPIIGGNPPLGRYCVFGNLFAHMGTAPTGPVYRVDQHPSMAHHPTTPAKDGDLCDHLARQTDVNIGLLDILTLDKGPADCLQHVHTLLHANQSTGLLIDLLNVDQMATIGNLLEALKPQAGPLFVVGSSSVEAALCSSGSAAETIPPPLLPLGHLPYGPVLIVSGSCSPVTAKQIETARSDGFAEVFIDPSGIWQPQRSRAIGLSAAQRLSQGQSIILHTCLGPDDRRLDHRHPKDRLNLGQVLGSIVKSCLQAFKPAALCFAGGDTSSQMARCLGIRSMEWAAEFVPGAPFCRALLSDPLVEGLLFNFKGGQVGSPDYFLNLRKRFR